MGKDGPDLVLLCKTCKVEIRVPRDRFIARFRLARPYPADAPPTPAIRLIDLLD